MTLVKSFMRQFHLTEMAQFRAFLGYTIAVYPTEGTKPHFHFIHKQTGRVGCIYLTKPKYFKHSGKTATLNHTEREELMKFLCKKDAQGRTVYNRLCFIWNSAAIDRPKAIIVPDGQIMPNYMDLNEYDDDDDDFLIVGNLKNVQLTIHANEANKKPHMHFVNLKTGEQGALSLQKAEYFNHDEYDGRLSNELLKEIYDYCSSACPINDKVKNFDFICVTWAKVNKNCPMSKNAPRYDLINKQ